eukprot:CAMPEP_0172508984 /NCGR_PEP_ID=MMETSP1066-20121228/216605_1 /TAXON_ID=671091 /ORGANISM="Coscinodiscus wailesii, Strain CCMP2513" /LENGTH=306 /DNA_ID=CAMNT_0013287249 /DNA_START=27 /DNA_END=943 /DNA_ORIENTATION=-
MSSGTSVTALRTGSSKCNNNLVTSQWRRRRRRRRADDDAIRNNFCYYYDGQGRKKRRSRATRRVNQTILVFLLALVTLLPEQTHSLLLVAPRTTLTPFLSSSQRRYRYLPTTTRSTPHPSFVLRPPVSLPTCAKSSLLHLSPSSSTSPRRRPVISPPLSTWTPPTISIALPALIGMMADPLLSLIDTFFVSQLGPSPLAALGACTSIFHLSFNAFRATTTATTSLVSSSLTTSPTPARARHVTRTSLRFGLVSGVLVTLLLLTAHRTILRATNVPPTSALFVPARRYLLVRAAAAPAVLYSMVGEG